MNYNVLGILTTISRKIFLNCLVVFLVKYFIAIF